MWVGWFFSSSLFNSLAILFSTSVLMSITEQQRIQPFNGLVYFFLIAQNENKWLCCDLLIHNEMTRQLLNLIWLGSWSKMKCPWKPSRRYKVVAELNWLGVDHKTCPEGSKGPRKFSQPVATHSIWFGTWHFGLQKMAVIVSGSAPEASKDLRGHVFFFPFSAPIYVGKNLYRLNGTFHSVKGKISNVSVEQCQVRRILGRRHCSEGEHMLHLQQCQVQLQASPGSAENGRAPWNLKESLNSDLAIAKLAGPGLHVR